MSRDTRRSAKRRADFLGVGNIFPCTVTKNGNEHIATLTQHPVSLPVGDVPAGTGPTSPPGSGRAGAGRPPPAGRGGRSRSPGPTTSPRGRPARRPR